MQESSLYSGNSVEKDNGATTRTCLFVIVTTASSHDHPSHLLLNSKCEVSFFCTSFLRHAHHVFSFQCLEWPLPAPLQLLSLRQTPPSRKAEQYQRDVGHVARSMDLPFLPTSWKTGDDSISEIRTMKKFWGGISENRWDLCTTVATTFGDERPSILSPTTLVHVATRRIGVSLLRITSHATLPRRLPERSSTKSRKS
jgi:hypothetical protein